MLCLGSDTQHVGARTGCGTDGVVVEGPWVVDNPKGRPNNDPSKVLCAIDLGAQGGDNDHVPPVRDGCRNQRPVIAKLALVLQACDAMVGGLIVDRLNEVRESRRVPAHGDSWGGTNLSATFCIPGELVRRGAVLAVAVAAVVLLLR